VESRGRGDRRGRASGELKDVEGSLRELRSILQAAAERRKEVESTANALRDELDGAAEGDSNESLEQMLADATKAAKDASKTADETANELAANDPDEAGREIVAATATRDKVEKSLQQLRQNERDLESSCGPSGRRISRPNSIWLRANRGVPKQKKKGWAMRQRHSLSFTRS
jgi:DNA repair exonuclease SbcCD ATPase subunit